MKLTAAQLRRWAQDQREYYAGSSWRSSLDMQERATVFGALIHARADLMDSKAGVDTGTAAECCIEYTYPLVGLVKVRGGRRIFVECPYNLEGEEHGIYVSFEWASDPSYEERDGRLVRFFIGTESTGPLAHYEAHYDGEQGQWFELSSQRGYGKEYAAGGTWSANKVAAPPEIFTKLEAIMNQRIAQQERIAQAKARLEAAQLMVLAQSQREMATSYARQGRSPIYDGQEIVCAHKADMAASHAAVTEARAQLILSQPGV